MSNSLGTLTLDLVAEVSRFNSGLDKASRIADQNAKKIQQNLQNIDDKINTVTASIKKFGAALGIGLSVNALHGWIKGATQAASDTAVFANRIDVTVESLTAMRYVAEQTGVSIDSFDASMMRLTRRLGAAVNGGGPAIATLERLGLSAESLLKMPLEDRLKTIGSAMQNLETQAERLTAAQDLAGDSARQLVPMFMMQGDEIDELADRGRRLGFVFSDEIANSADSVLSSLGDISGALSNLAFYIAGKFLPTIEEALNRITVDDIENALNGIKKGIDLVITSGKVLAVLFFGRLTASLYASAAAFVASQIQAMRYQATLAKMAGITKGTAIGLTALGTATRGVTFAMGALGGPVGLLAVVAGSLVMFGRSAKHTGLEVDELETRLSTLEDRLDRMSEKQLKREALSFSKEIESLSNERKSLEKELSKTEEMLRSYEERLKLPGYANDKSTLIYIDRLKEKQTELGGKIDDTSDSLSYLNKMLGMVKGALNEVSIAGDNAFSQTSKKFEELASKLRDEIGRIGLNTSSEIFEYELVYTDKYDDLNDDEIEKLRILHKQKDEKREQYRLAMQSNRASAKGIDLAKEYQRIMESTLSDEERRGLELQKNLEILRQYGASEADMLAVRRAAYESMSVDLPGYDGSGDTLTAQLARINENIAELDQWREEQLQKIQQAYGEEESALAESIARKEEIERQYRERRAQYEGEMSQELLNIGQNLSAESLSALEAAGMEASGIYKAMFLANKAAAFANAIISAQEAGAKALAVMPGPAGIALSKMITGVGMVNAGIIAATGLKGMAHSGIDKVPETGTWLLEKGERVVTANTSARLDAVLENISRQRENGSFGNQTPQVNSSVSVVITNEGTVEQRQDDTSGNEIARVIEGKVVEVIVKELRPGGILAKRG